MLFAMTCALRHDVMKRAPRPGDYSQGVRCFESRVSRGGSWIRGNCHVDVIMVGLALVMAVGACGTRRGTAWSAKQESRGDRGCACERRLLFMSWHEDPDGEVAPPRTTLGQTDCWGAPSGTAWELDTYVKRGSSRAPTATKNRVRSAPGP
jgi:hypothetical protein